jgi:hypothetical protein
MDQQTLLKGSANLAESSPFGVQQTLLKNSARECRARALRFTCRLFLTPIQRNSHLARTYLINPFAAGLLRVGPNFRFARHPASLQPRGPLCLRCSHRGFVGQAQSPTVIAIDRDAAAVLEDCGHLPSFESWFLYDHLRDRSPGDGEDAAAAC